MDINSFDNEDFNLRFRAEKTGDILRFKGVISDVTTFDHLEDLINNATICDLSELRFGSWIGFSSLISFLKSSNRQLLLQGVSTKAFQIIRLLDPDATCLKIKQAEVRALDDRNHEVLTFIDLECLRVPLKENKEFFKIDDLQIISPIRFLLPDFQRSNYPMNLPNWTNDRQDELSFWLSYTEFAIETIAVSIDLLEAGLANCLWTLSELHASLSAVDRALFVLDSSSQSNLGELVSQSIVIIREQFQAAISAISAGEQLARTRYVHIREASYKQSPFITEFYVAIEYFLESIKRINKPGTELESYGARVIEALVRLRVSREQHQKILATQQLSESDLNKIRDAFSIMDIMSEGDPEATAELLSTELSRLEKYIENSVVNLQVFDLARQIIDHRVQEAQQVIENLSELNRSTIGFSKLRSELEDQIFRKLVTDQEKRAQQYFLYQIIHTKSETDKDPGDILFF